MEESLNNLPRIFIPRDNIRSIQSELKAQLHQFEIDGSDTIFLETSNVCDCVRDRILFYEDEPHLSKCQNNCRRIFIASELLLRICSVYWEIVDYEFSKTVRDLMQWDKYQNISRRITQKLHRESKTEKNFAKEALNKLKEAEIRSSEVVEQGSQQPEIDLEHLTRQETSSVVRQTVATAEDGAPRPEANGNMEDTISGLLDNLTTMRDEPAIDTSSQHFPVSDVSRRDVPLPDTVIESSIQEPEMQEKIDESLKEILQILEHQIPQTEAIEQPETLIHSPDKLPNGEAVQEQPPVAGEPAASSEESEKWSLPSLEAVEPTRKRPRRLIIDEEIVIHQYAERAMRLNKNINTQRVEVFEGPPEIIQAFSTNHIMKIPGFRSSAFRDVRSSKLSTLYNRHLKTGTKPVEPTLFERRPVDEQRGNISKARANQDTVESVGARAGMRSAAERSDLLVEAATTKSRLEDLEITQAVVPPQESIIGMPVSRIVSSVIPPLEENQLERINNAVISPRGERLQGQSIDPKKTPPWFLYTKENPPSAKYREFNYVYKSLQRYWLLYENEKMEKCVTLREFLSLESSDSTANFLTVLRIVDKMSLQRKVKLEYKKGDVFIRPFDSPHFSKPQVISQRELIN